MKAVLTSSAHAELLEGMAFYERSSGAILSRAFMLEFDRTVDLLCLHPQMGSVWRGAIRRWALSRLHTASSMKFEMRSFLFSPLLINAAGLEPGQSGDEHYLRMRI